MVQIPAWTNLKRVLNTFFLGELVEETRFPNAHVTNNDVFENVRVVVWPSGRHVCCFDAADKFLMIFWGRIWIGTDHQLSKSMSICLSDVLRINSEPLCFVY